MQAKNLKNFSIGIFDSGVGGLSVWREIIKILPQNRYYYLSDNAYCPYGPRPKSEIIDRARAVTTFLVNKGADIVVIACNTATSAAISTLRQEFSVPFIGMEPAVKPAALTSESGVIGVLATKGTLNGTLYNNTKNKFAEDVEVIEMVGEGLVKLVEDGQLTGEETEMLLKKYITPMVDKGADRIVLGCTHYPFLTETIKKITGENIEIVDPAPAVAKHLYDILQHMEPRETDCDYTGQHNRTLFYTTGKRDTLMEMARRIMPGIEDKNFNAADI
jgi:glutamate racemase